MTVKKYATTLSRLNKQAVWLSFEPVVKSHTVLYNTITYCPLRKFSQSTTTIDTLCKRVEYYVTVVQGSTQHTFTVYGREQFMHLRIKYMEDMTNTVSFGNDLKPLNIIQGLFFWSTVALLFFKEEQCLKICLKMSKVALLVLWKKTMIVHFVQNFATTAVSIFVSGKSVSELSRI